MAATTRRQARWPNVALYGTIGLCTATSLARASTNASVAATAQKQDRPRFDAAIKLRDSMNRNFTCSLRNISEGRWHTLVTSAWNHTDLFHYLGNMLGLWSFGRSSIAYFGVRGFLSLFYGGAVLGNAACLSLDAQLPSSMKSLTSTSSDGRNEKRQIVAERNYLGASGGVSSLITAAACRNPYGMMIMGIAFVPVPIPMFVFPFAFAAFSVWAQTNGFQGDTAHLGHLGGLLYGFAWFVTRGRARRPGV